MYERARIYREGRIGKFTGRDMVKAYTRQVMHVYIERGGLGSLQGKIW